MSTRRRLVTLGLAAAVAVAVAVVVLATTGGGDDSEDPASATPSPRPTPQATVSSSPEAEPRSRKRSADATSTPAVAPNEPDAPQITVKDGKPVGGIAQFLVERGDRIRFEVTADVADEVHVHAYDLREDVGKPGDTVSFDFRATITGTTEAELEDAGLRIASIRVVP